MQADNRYLNLQIQRFRADAMQTNLAIMGDNTPLTANDARCMVKCLRNTPRVHSFGIYFYRFHDAAFLSVFRNGLPLCTSITEVAICSVELCNEELERLLPAFYNTSVTMLFLSSNNIQGQRGGEVIRDLVAGNKSLLELDLSGNPIGQEGTGGIGKGLVVNKQLRSLNLFDCRINNGSLANLLAASEGMINNSLTNLHFDINGIEGAEGGRQLTLLLQRFRALKVLSLNGNDHLGPLGARELAPGLAAASHLEVLDLFNCGLGNEGVVNLVPVGQVNRSLTRLLIGGYDQDLVGVDSVISLASRCTNLDRFDVYDADFSPHQQHRLDLLLDRKRLYAQASALAGSTFPILFRAVQEAHRHEHGLSAIFVILQNDGDDYFCTAHNRAMA